MNFAKKKTINVGVSVTLDNTLEVIVVNPSEKKVLDFKKVPMEYNYQTKDIGDYVTFVSTLKTILLDEMHLNPKNIDLNLTIPSIYINTDQVPATNDADAIRSDLASRATDSYLFKRHEPEIAYEIYSNPNNKDELRAVYSAIQKSVCDSLKACLLEDIGIEKFSISNPYASIINALKYLGKIENQANSNDIWNFVQITDNGFTLFSMMGTKIREINETPLPLNTFAEDEIYESLALSLQSNLSIYPASSLFILSRTNLLSAQILLNNMDLRCDVDWLENNKYAQEPLLELDETVDTDLAKIISVEVLGSAITDKNSPLKLSYYVNNSGEEEVYGFINLFGNEIPITASFINVVVIAAIVIIVAVAGVVYLIGDSYKKKYTADFEKYSSEKADIQRQIDKAKGESEGNVENIITDISKNNESTRNYFNAISTNIPQNLWLTSYYSDSTGAINIKGNSSEVANIYDFFKFVKDSNKSSDINLSKLEYNDIEALLAPDGQGDRTMTFEIKNTAYDSSIKMNAAQKTAEEGAEGDSNNAGNKANNQANVKTGIQPKKSGVADEKPENLPEVPEYNPTN